jgi:hypothetical protein
MDCERWYQFWAPFCFAGLECLRGCGDLYLMGSLGLGTGFFKLDSQRFVMGTSREACRLSRVQYNIENMGFGEA